MNMKLAIVSSYDEMCAIAAYAKAIEQTFRDTFDVTVLNLKSAALVGNPALHNSPAAEEHIDRICRELESFDCVNIHLEWGLFGADIASIQRRVIKLCEAGKRLILSLHTLNIRSSDGPEWQNMERAVIEALKQRSSDRPYWFITHLPREAEALRNIFGIDNVVDFPLVFLSQKEVRHYQSMDAAVWKESLGFKKDDIVILRMGYLAEHKDSLISLRSMRLLPPHYKLAFAGGQHPRGITPYAVSPLVKEITDYLDHYDEPALKERNHHGAAVTTLADRICFLGNVTDEELYRAIACADFMTITHLETSQGGSGTASIALQMERPTILSYNSFFIEYAKYYEGGFSFFTMGNHYELRDKILRFDPAQVERLKKYGKKYSLDGLAALYEKMYKDMLDGKGNNAGRPVQPLQTVAYQSLAYRMFFKTLGIVKRALRLIRQVRQKIKSELA
jgi:glycosyltransferase involved in cell wall biosynthesis